MTKTITIFATDESNFRKKLNSLNKKLARYDAEVIIDTWLPGTKKFTVGNVIVYRKVITIQMVIPETRGKQGVKFLGNISMKSGVLQAYSPDNSSVHQYFDDSGKCDHCSHNRQRNTWSYFLEEGIVKQIGSTCVMDYYGFPINELFDSMDASFTSLEAKDGPEEVDDDIIVRLMKSADSYVTLHKFLPALKKTTINFNKLWEKADPRGTSFEAVSNYFKGNVSEISSEEYQEMVEKIKTRWPIGKASTDFEFNILSNMWDDSGRFIDSYPISNLGIVSWAIWKALSEKPCQENSGTYVGVIGEKITMECTMKLDAIVDGYYGPLHLYSFNTDKGLLKWFSSKEVAVKEGKILITATVKKHKEYKGNKETIVTRVKIH